MGVSNKRTLTKTRRKTRDLDQIQNDIISTKHLANYKGTKAQEDLPGLGRHYCVECARWFETSTTLLAHKRAKPHKRRYVFGRSRLYTLDALELTNVLLPASNSSKKPTPQRNPRPIVTDTNTITMWEMSIWPLDGAVLQNDSKPTIPT